MNNNFVANINTIVTANGGTVRVTVAQKEMHAHGAAADFANTLRIAGFKVEKNKADHSALTIFGTVEIPEEPEVEPEATVEETKPLISDALAADIERAYEALQSGVTTVRNGYRTEELKYSINLHDTKLDHAAFDWLECAGIIGDNRIYHEALITAYDGSHSFERHIRVCTLAPEYQKLTWDEVRGELTTCDTVVKLAREKIASAFTNDAKKFFEAFGFGTHAELVNYIKSHQLMTYPLYSHKDFPQDILDQCLENLQRDNFITPDPYGFALSAKALRNVLALAEKKLADDPHAVVPTWIHSKLAQHRLEAENAPVEVEANSESEPAPEAEPESTKVDWDSLMSQILDVMTRSKCGIAKSLSPDEIAEAMGVELTDALIHSIHALDYVGMIFKADSNDGERYTLSDMHKPEPEPDPDNPGPGGDAPAPDAAIATADDASATPGAEPAKSDFDEDKVIDAMRETLGDTKSLSTFDIAKALGVTHDGDFRNALRTMASAGKITKVGSNAKAEYYTLPNASPHEEASAVAQPDPDGFTENQRLVYDTVRRLNQEHSPSQDPDLVTATGLKNHEVLAATSTLRDKFWMSNDWVTGKGFTGWIARTPEERAQYVPTGTAFKFVLDKLAKYPDGLPAAKLVGKGKGNTAVMSAIKQLVQSQKIICECMTGKYKLSPQIRSALKSAWDKCKTKTELASESEAESEPEASAGNPVPVTGGAKSSIKITPELMALACEDAILQFLKDSGGSSDVQHIMSRMFSRYKEHEVRKALASLRARGEVQVRGKGGWANYRLAPPPLTDLGLETRYTQGELDKLREDVLLYSAFTSIMGY